MGTTIRCRLTFEKFLDIETIDNINEELENKLYEYYYDYEDGFGHFLAKNSVDTAFFEKLSKKYTNVLFTIISVSEDFFLEPNELLKHLFINGKYLGIESKVTFPYEDSVFKMAKTYVVEVCDHKEKDFSYVRGNTAFFTCRDCGIEIKYNKFE